MTTTTTTLSPGVTPRQASMVQWTCTTTCAWGSLLSNPAVSWSALTQLVSEQGNYASSLAVYLPGDQANGVTVSIWSSSPQVYVGRTENGHRAVAQLSAGDSYRTGAASDEIVRVQSWGNFTYSFTPSP